MPSNPFHEGELALQQQAGEAGAGLRNGRIVGDRIPEGALPFIVRQQLAVLASIDSGGGLWASVLLGPAGFAQAPDLATLHLDLRAAAGHPQDPLWQNLETDPRLGLLFIELATRRRLRVNGRGAMRPGGILELQVEEAYPNCPKYIQRRHSAPGLGAVGTILPAATHGQALLASHRTWITGADTFFVASAHPRGNADASHRGGKPGFVRWLDEHTLEVPDYAGNSMFNTLGNFAVNPRAGLVFPDFARRRTLQLSGRATVLWNPQAPPAGSTVTNRAWRFEVERWIESQQPPLYEWELLDESPFNPAV